MAEQSPENPSVNKTVVASTTPLSSWISAHSKEVLDYYKMFPLLKQIRKAGLNLTPKAEDYDPEWV